MSICPEAKTALIELYIFVLWDHKVNICQQTLITFRLNGKFRDTGGAPKHIPHRGP